MKQTNTMAATRFTFFLVQAISMIAMGILITLSARG
jgi:hypothetical protein